MTRQARPVGATPQQSRRRRYMPCAAPRTHGHLQPTAHCRTPAAVPRGVRALFCLCGGTAADLADGDQTAVSIKLFGTDSDNIVYVYCLLVPSLAEMNQMRVGDEGAGGGGGLCCWGFAVRGGVAVRGGGFFLQMALVGAGSECGGGLPPPPFVVHPGGSDGGGGGGRRMDIPHSPVWSPPIRAFMVAATAGAATAAAAEGGNASATIATATVAIASHPAPATHRGPYLQRVAAALARGCVGDVVAAAVDAEAVAAAHPPIEDKDCGRESASQHVAFSARLTRGALAALARGTLSVLAWALVGGASAAAASWRSLCRRWAAGGVIDGLLDASAMWRRLRRRGKPPTGGPWGRPRRTTTPRYGWGGGGAAAAEKRGGGALRPRVADACRGVAAAAAAG